jgi:hypothetical protein
MFIIEKLSQHAFPVEIRVAETNKYTTILIAACRADASVFQHDNLQPTLEDLRQNSMDSWNARPDAIGSPFSVRLRVLSLLSNL